MNYSRLLQYVFRFKQVSLLKASHVHYLSIF